MSVEKIGLLLITETTMKMVNSFQFQILSVLQLTIKTKSVSTAVVLILRTASAIVVGEPVVQCSKFF